MKKFEDGVGPITEETVAYRCIKAGDVGKGFGVVATEIRKLADSSN